MPILIEIAFRAALAIATILILTRIHGLRSFSKMSGFDFAITVSIGSVLAGAVTTLNTSVWTFAGAIAALFLIQICISQARIRSAAIQQTVDNAPLLLMENGEMLPDNMNSAGVTESDLWAKLREANAYNFAHVRAVVMETTGDVSVLHGSPDGPNISPEILQGVRRD